MLQENTITTFICKFKILDISTIYMHNVQMFMFKRYHCLVHPGVRDKRRVSEIDLS